MYYYIYMRANSSLFWLVTFVFFLLWALRVLFLPAPMTTTGLSFLNNTSLRILLFFCPFLLAAVFLHKESLRDTFALHKPKVTGIIIASVYSLGLLYFELTTKAVTLPTNPWVFLNFPFAPVIEELVFRGYIFTNLERTTGKVQAVLISSVLFVLIHFPGWIFLSELKGEAFLTATGQVFLFSLVQGVIRLYAKSVYPNIAVHLINNALLIS